MTPSFSGKQSIGSGLATALVLGALVAPDAPAQIFGMSDEQEIAIGREAAREIERREPVLQDPEVTGYVDALGQELARHSSRSDIPYHFKVLDKDEVNAFALPGGFIYVNEGILDVSESASQFASVVAHEIAHVAARHGVDQMQKAQLTGLGLGLLESILGGGTTSDIANVAARLVATGAFMEYSRDQEREADRLGARMMYDAGYDPEGMVGLFRKLQSLRDRDPNLLEEFFSSHPSPGDRIESISELVRSFPEKEGLIEDTAEFHDIAQ